LSDADAERRIRALRLMRAALDITGSERAAWLDEHCSDAELRADVDRNCWRPMPWRPACSTRRSATMSRAAPSVPIRASVAGIGPVSC
jgi:hypothetical protein